ncbi:uncharacterized protein N7484_003404 [Penicillium longicatenatum]|uniref:uncharacterized protein n=1 Tax=Penicillium longicatenatum TaxID=1561947 RepID=UPI002549644E|nr:uncharacterized protein N7484_003404 [Penicillium longicatenatum]KAJ5649681.1 hypothetical protein N7484_003404 [Penicillium longicatenatum]
MTMVMTWPRRPGLSWMDATRTGSSDQSRCPRNYTENPSSHFSSSHDPELVSEHEPAEDIRTNSPAKTSNQIPTPTIRPESPLNLLLATHIHRHLRVMSSQ